MLHLFKGGEVFFAEWLERGRDHHFLGVGAQVRPEKFPLVDSSGGLFAGRTRLFFQLVVIDGDENLEAFAERFRIEEDLFPGLHGKFAAGAHADEADFFAFLALLVLGILLGSEVEHLAKDPASGPTVGPVDAVEQACPALELHVREDCSFEKGDSERKELAKEPHQRTLQAVAEGGSMFGIHGNVLRWFCCGPLVVAGRFFAKLTDIYRCVNR